MIATSETHPLRIDVLQPPGASGWLGMTLCPGKFQRSGGSVVWSRELAVDVAAIKAWGASLVISLITDSEMRLLQVRRLPVELEAVEIEWWHLPIHDGTPPGGDFLNEWPRRSAELHERLRAGNKVLVHCRGGLGRAGTVVAMLLIEAGSTPEDAIRRVRNARPGAIETAGQERFLRSWSPYSAAGNSAPA